MSNLIALVTRETQAEEECWLDALQAAMPNEIVLSIRDMLADDLDRVDIAIIANPDPADLERLPNLKWVHSLWAGVERLVLELKEFSPPVVRLVDPELAETMAEAVLAWSLYLSRDMPAYAAQQRQRVWEQRPYRSARDLRVGILGLGALGTRATQKLKLAGFNVAGWSKRPKHLDGVESFDGAEGFDAILSRSDIVVCLLPLTPETTSLIGSRELALFRENASLINFGRGRIVNTEALIDALDRRIVKHAVLDVFEIEPLDAGSPLWAHPHLTVLPHISGPTNQSTASAIVAARIADYRLTGKLPHGVDFSRGY